MPAVPGQRAVASTIFLCLTIYTGHIICIHIYVYIYMCEDYPMPISNHGLPFAMLRPGMSRRTSLG